VERIVIGGGQSIGFQQFNSRVTVEQVDFVKHEENSMPPNKKPRLNMDWFDDVVLVTTAGPRIVIGGGQSIGFQQFNSRITVVLI
jgi:hypothetical protein